MLEIKMRYKIAAKVEASGFGLPLCVYVLCFNEYLLNL